MLSSFEIVTDGIGIMSNTLASHYAQYEEITLGRVRERAERNVTQAVPSRIHADMHHGVYTALLGCWAVFLSLFWMTFMENSQTVFLMAFILAFTLVAFGLPVVMNRTGKYLPGTEGTLGAFLKSRVATIDGSVTGMEALIQVILVPACLTVGGVAIGLIITASRFSY
jgi:hypothetical protein